MGSNPTRATFFFVFLFCFSLVFVSPLFFFFVFVHLFFSFSIFVSFFLFLCTPFFFKLFVFWWTLQPFWFFFLSKSFFSGDQFSGDPTPFHLTFYKFLSHIFFCFRSRLELAGCMKRFRPKRQSRKLLYFQNHPTQLQQHVLLTLFESFPSCALHLPHLYQLSSRQPQLLHPPHHHPTFRSPFSGG